MHLCHKHWWSSQQVEIVKYCADVRTVQRKIMGCSKKACKYYVRFLCWRAQSVIVI